MKTVTFAPALRAHSTDTSKKNHYNREQHTGRALARRSKASLGRAGRANLRHVQRKHGNGIASADRCRHEA